MDNGILEDKCPRYRSPTFSKEEVTVLLNLIEKYKLFILNKSITSAACQAKDAAWTKIEKQFNSQELGHKRTADSLRVKWENMKRDARKLSKNLLDSNCSDMDAAIAKIVTMISEAENISSIDTPQDILDDDADNEKCAEEQKDTANNFSKFWDDNTEQEDEEGQTERSGIARSTRSMNFSPQECYLLLQCAKKEKKHIFTKEITSRAIELKNSAWSRIANSYNKLSPQKRSSKTLKSKFTSIKCMAKKVGIKGCCIDLGNERKKREKQVNDSCKNIKQEPEYDKMDADSDAYDDADDADDVTCNGEKPDNNYVEVPGVDPLSAVLNENSEICSSSSNLGAWNFNQSENKEVAKLKLELLNYQLETAKQERKRIEDALREDAAAREARATETALRLRAARLEAAAAALRLPPAHPALAFPPEEARAQHYMTQYHQS